MNDKNVYDYHAVSRDDINLNSPSIKKSKEKNGDVLRDKFDGKGKLIWRERLVYNKKDKTTSKVITQFTRNDKGLIINRHDEIYNASGELIECKELVRTGEGKSTIIETSKFQYRDGKVAIRKDNTVNSDKKLLNECTLMFDGNSNIIFSVSSRYNDSGDLIEKSMLTNEVNNDNEITNSKIEFFDDKDRLISISEKSHFNYNKNNGDVRCEERKYDKNNELVEIVYLSKNLNKDGVTYDVCEEFYYSEQDLNNENEFKVIVSTYDISDNLIFSDTTCGNETIRVYQEFDSFGKLKSKVKKVQRTHDGFTYQESTYTYDANGVEIGAVEITHTHDDSSRRLQSSDEFHRTNDSKGQMTSSTTIRKEYDSNGNLISSVEDKSNPAGELVSDPTKESISSSENKVTEHTTATQKYNDQTTEKFTKKETSDADVNFSERTKDIYTLRH